LHPDFDVSPYHLNKLFTLLDTNGDGELTVEQVREAFKAMNAFPDLTHDQLSQVYSIASMGLGQRLAGLNRLEPVRAPFSRAIHRLFR
jgi:hypothetical protein